MRLIDADKFLRSMIKRYHCIPLIERHNEGEPLNVALNEQPTVDAVPVVPGEWIEIEVDLDGDLAYQCSVCESVQQFIYGGPGENGYNFCPRCGNRLRGDLCNNDR